VLEEQRRNNQKSEGRSGSDFFQTTEIGRRHGRSPKLPRATSSGRPRGRCPVLRIEMIGR
jgi:hypothetical protein